MREISMICNENGNPLYYYYVMYSGFFEPELKWRERIQPMINILLCDDDSSFLNLETKLIGKYMNANRYHYAIEAFSSGIDLLKKGEELEKYDIIFLDVDMKQLNGLDTAKQIRKISKQVTIVLVTAYYHYVLEGYKVKAYLYVLKDEATLFQSLTECFDTYISERKLMECTREFPFREGKKKIAVGSIVYVESELHYLFFFVYDEERLIRFSMKGKLDDMQEKLNGFSFCRIHKSILVNLRYVKNVQRYRVQLSDNIELNVSQSRYMQVVQDYMDYRGDR